MLRCPLHLVSIFLLMPLSAVFAGNESVIDPQRVTEVTPCALNLALKAQGVEFGGLSSVSNWADTHDLPTSLLKQRMEALTAAGNQVSTVHLKGRNQVRQFLSSWSDLVDSEHANQISDSRKVKPGTVVRTAFHLVSAAMFLSFIYVKELWHPNQFAEGLGPFFLGMQLFFHHSAWSSALDGIRNRNLSYVARNFAAFTSLVLPVILIPELRQGHEKGLSLLMTMAMGTAAIDGVLTAAKPSGDMSATPEVRPVVPAVALSTPVPVVRSIPRSIRSQVMGSGNNHHYFVQLRAEEPILFDEARPAKSRYIDVVLYEGEDDSGREPELFIVGSDLEPDEFVGTPIRISGAR